MGVKERKERERKQRVNDILESARKLFEEKGFLNTTLQDVAQAAEISVGLIYRYFQSKEDIFASLALKGAIELDAEIAKILKKRSEYGAAPEVLVELAKTFFQFYGPYGEYFDMLLYSYKGMKQVQIHSNTLTSLMSVTLASLDQIKNFIQETDEFRASDEDEALKVVFLLWGVLLGCHKIFDSQGRGHILAFGKSQDEYLKEVVKTIWTGIGRPIPSTEYSKDNRSHDETSFRSPEV